MKFTAQKALIAVGLVIVAVVLLLPFDTIILKQFVNLIDPAQKSLMRSISNQGLYPLYTIFLALFIYGIIRKKQELKKVCLVYLKAQLLFSFLLTRLLKIGFGRIRPSRGQGWSFFSIESGHDAFPSGHAADAFVSGIFLFYLLKNSKYSNYRYLPILYAGFIALTRMVINVHYPSDVLAGTAIGVLGAWFYLKRLSDSPPHEPAS
jgi:undecaprenyl-diphosphatase